MADRRKASVHERWAHFRFSVVGPLLAAPPEAGELQQQLEQLAAKTWRHPVTAEPVEFSFPTVERWYYRAKNSGADPVGVLRRQVRKDAGQQGRLGVRNPAVPDRRGHRR